MKLSLLLSLLLCFSFTSTLQAQRTKRIKYEHKFSYIGLSAGVTLPTSDFGRVEDRNDLGMSATTGVQLSLIGAKHLTRYFDIGGRLSYSIHAFDNVDTELQYDLTNVDIGSFNTIFGSVGPIVKFPLGEGQFFDIKLFVGYMNLSYPDLDGAVVEGARRAEFLSDYALGEKFNAAVLNPGISYRYYVSDNMSFSIDAEYLSSGIDYSNKEYQVQWWSLGVSLMRRLGSTI